MKSSLEGLRDKYPVFTYEGFSSSRRGDILKAAFHFSIGNDIKFNPEISIHSLDVARLASISSEILDNLIFHLGLIEMFSYWKATCSPSIVIRAGHLDSDQLEWWRDLLLHGMGEYFFVNNIDFTGPDFIHFACAPSSDFVPVVYSESLPKNSNLVLTSGGKDTALSLEMLTAAKKNFNCLLLNPTIAATQLSAHAGCKKPIIVSRQIDPLLFKLNESGYLNGHTPFSAYLAFLGVTCALLGGYGRVVVSNERSSDEGNVRFCGEEINHQYSKTFRFERRFQEYSEKYLAPSIRYFSMVRPLYEIQITCLLAKYSESLLLFRSCNRGQRDNSWCGRCPKCVSVFVLLYPFIPFSDLERIFGRDLFEDRSLIPIIKELTGLAGHKPFECVGTHTETLAALQLGLEVVKRNESSLPAVWDFVETHVFHQNGATPRLAKELLNSWSDDHGLPADFVAILKHHWSSVLKHHLRPTPMPRRHAAVATRLAINAAD